MTAQTKERHQKENIFMKEKLQKNTLQVQTAPQKVRLEHHCGKGQCYPYGTEIVKTYKKLA